MIFTIITFFIILSILVFVHELGHFWTARRFGVKADEFGLGMPPRIIGIQKLKGWRLKPVIKTETVDSTVSEGVTLSGQEAIETDIHDDTEEIDVIRPTSRWRLIKGGDEPVYSEEEEKMEKDTIFSLNWIPMGGFVKIKGEDGDQAGDKDSFGSRPIWQRAIILLAGVSMNIVLAIVLISGGYMIGLPQVLDGLKPNAVISDRQVQVVEVLPDSPAAAAGIEMGDVILAIDGQAFTSSDELKNYVAKNDSKTLKYQIKRAGDVLEKEATPQKIAESETVGIGVGIVESGIVRYPFFTAIWEGVKATFIITWAVLVAFYELIKGLIFGQGVGANLSGPVGIAVLTGQVAHMGFVYLLQFTAMLSINLAIINALPFPALDGGRVLFLIIEKIKGRPVQRELEGKIHYIGYALLMLLVVFVTFKDVLRYAGKFKDIWERLIS